MKIFEEDNNIIIETDLFKWMVYGVDHNVSNTTIIKHLNELIEDIPIYPIVNGIELNETFNFYNAEILHETYNEVILELDFIKYKIALIPYKSVIVE